jgi:hypothetical protein
MQCTCAILSFVARPALRYFPTLSHKRHNFRKKKLIEHKSASSFSLDHLSEIFLVIRRIERYIITNAPRSSCKVPVILSDFNKTWILLPPSPDRFPKTPKYEISWNPSRGSRVVPRGQTDMTNQIQSCPHTRWFSTLWFTAARNKKFEN